MATSHCDSRFKILKSGKFDVGFAIITIQPGIVIVRTFNLEKESIGKDLHVWAKTLVCVSQSICTKEKLKAWLLSSKILSKCNFTLLTSRFKYNHCISCPFYVKNTFNSQCWKQTFCCVMYCCSCLINMFIETAYSQSMSRINEHNLQPVLGRLCT